MAMQVNELKDGWTRLVLSIGDSYTIAQDLISIPFESFLNTGDISGLDRIQGLAIDDYMTAYDKKDGEEKKKVSKAWEAVADRLRARCTYRKLSLSCDSLPSIVSPTGKGTPGIRILPQKDALAIRKAEDEAKAEKLNTLRAKSLELKEAEAYKAMASLTAENIAQQISVMLAASGASLPDVIIHCLASDGEAVRQLGSFLGQFKSAFEIGQEAEAKAEAEAAKAATKAAKEEAAKLARQAKAEAAKLARQAKAEAAKA